MTEAELFTRLNKIFRKVFDDGSIVVRKELDNAQVGNLLSLVGIW